MNAQPGTFHEDSARTRLIEALVEAFAGETMPPAPTTTATVERLKAIMEQAASLVGDMP